MSTDNLIGGGTLAIGSLLTLMGMFNVDTKIVDLSSLLRNNRVFPEGLIPSANIDTSVAIGLGAIGAGGGIMYAGAKQLKDDDRPMSEEEVAAITEMVFGGSLLLPALLSLLLSRETSSAKINLFIKGFFVESCLALNFGQFFTLLREDEEKTNTATNESKFFYNVAEGVSYSGGAFGLIMHIFLLFHRNYADGSVAVYKNQFRHVLFALLGVAGSASLTNGTFKLIKESS